MPDAPEVKGPVNFDHPAAVRWNFEQPGNPQPDAKRLKIAIVGFASSSRHKAPYDDPTWEIWGLNQLYRHIPRCDRHFEIHVNWNEHVVPGTDHVAWIREAPVPVYMNERHVDTPNVCRFPIEETEKLWRRYFTSTIAHQIAFAMLQLRDPEDPTKAIPGAELALYGVDLAVGTEYFDQKPCAEAWIARADAMGIQVTIPAESSLLTATHVYGYEVEPELGGIQISELDAFAAMLTKEREANKRLTYAHDGALQAVEEIKQLSLLRARGVKTGSLVVQRQ